MPANKKVTLEQVYVKLEQVYAKLESHDRHFENHDAHFEKHDRQFEGITKLLFKVEDSLKAEIGKVMERVRKLEANSEKQAGDLEKLQQEYFALVQSVKRIEKNLETRPTPRSNEDELSDVLTRLDRIERHLGLAETGPRTAP